MQVRGGFDSTAYDVDYWVGRLRSVTVLGRGRNFDQVQVLSILTSMLVRNNALVGIILKHNDSKTIKFIFRNIYYLLAIHVTD